MNGLKKALALGKNSLPNYSVGSEKIGRHTLEKIAKQIRPRGRAEGRMEDEAHEPS